MYMSSPRAEPASLFNDAAAFGKKKTQVYDSPSGVRLAMIDSNIHCTTFDMRGGGRRATLQSSPRPQWQNKNKNAKIEKHGTGRRC
jgi:hypothetical protein